MNAQTKITLKDLIARKEQMLEAKKTPKRKNLFVKSLNGTIVIEEPSRSLVTEAQEMENGKNDVYMVYQSVVEPNLKDSSLQQEFGCVEPLDIVDILFSAGEVMAISKACLELAGYSEDSVKAVEDLKN